MAAATAPVVVPPEKIVVLGCGSFGTAIGALFARNGHQVVLLDRKEVLDMSQLNPRAPSFSSDGAFDTN